ncbi:protein kinase [Trypanosoma conorhini]|uniref:non-specific serine/threonine protein kinase n=1 Tax=Trypanosoma conorhini TaxID=83891 RepID=A0A3R7K2T0_9TRYP|nr:protein kinase [Trypanosoma conorhini]RNF00770.1 protein kinase [Trypanosoma conorhini]
MGGGLSSCSSGVRDFLSYVGVLPRNARHPASVVVGGIEYAVGQLLGEGGSAFVYKGRDVHAGNAVALKRFTLTDHNYQAHCMEEAALHRSLCPHPAIVNFYDSGIVERPECPLPELWIVMECVEAPSLANYINMRMAVKQPFTIREAYEVGHALVGVVAHLHSQSPPVSHWDIKAENFLFEDSQNLKLCDFGSASRLYYEPQNALQVSIAEAELGDRMTLLYRPPESLDLWSRRRVDTKADIWGLGVLMYLLVFFEMPFEANAMEIMDGVPRRFCAGRCETIPEGFGPLIELVVTRMLVKEPSLRADVFEVSQRLSALSHISPFPPPNPDFQIPQRPRFE